MPPEEYENSYLKRFRSEECIQAINEAAQLVKPQVFQYGFLISMGKMEDVAQKEDLETLSE